MWALPWASTVLDVVYPVLMAVMPRSAGVASSSGVLVANNTSVYTGASEPNNCHIQADYEVDNVTIRNNTVRGPTCGIGVAGGRNVVVDGNRVESHVNVGIYVWRYQTPYCDAITVSNNTVVQSPAFWDGGGCGTVTVTGNSW